ncbi:MAG: hypothetical protein F6K14_23320 [Symploca sp. SIO2C1]|nr:hypothetical protein [Symploca sp. SIO2C1]
MRVFVLDKNHYPLDPCHPARARELLHSRRAKVYRRYPFTIVLQDRTVEESTTHSHRIKIDPGSKVTGFAVVQEETGRITNALEVSHRGQQIKDSLESRRALRRGRRNRKTRYRKSRFLNRTRKQGWLPPSLESRISNIETWVRRIRKLCPITAISQELVRFDLQQIKVAAKGHGTRQRCRPDKFGFPKAHAPKAKFFQGFQTGDIVKADVQKGKFTGQYVGRIAIRFRPSFVLQLPNQKFDVHPKYLKTIHRNDGYEYQF